MNIASKLSVIVALTAVAVCVTVGVALGIARGASFYDLSTQHFYANAELGTALNQLRRGASIDTPVLQNALHHSLWVAERCLSDGTVLDSLALKLVDTRAITRTCLDERETVQRALEALDRHADGTLTDVALLTILFRTERRLISNGGLFEQPVRTSASLVLNVLIPLIITVSLIAIGFMVYLSRSLTASVRRVTTLLRDDPSIDDLDERVERGINNDLAELLRAAQARTRSDLLNRELSHELEYEVSKRTASLRAANQELAEFAYRSSHDLKAPLSTSKQLAIFIDQDIESGRLDEARQNAQRIVSRMKRLEELIADIVSLTKAGFQTSDSEPIEMGELYDEVISSACDAESAQHIDVQHQVDICKPIFAERERLTTVLRYLLSNAIEYRDHNKPTSFVRLAADERTDRFVLTVEDNGLGIPASRQSEVFDMFKRFHPHIGHGSGLGLSIVKKHVDHLSGTIDFASSPRGTTFTIQLPKQDFAHAAGLSTHH